MHCPGTAMWSHVTSMHKTPIKGPLKPLQSTYAVEIFTVNNVK